MQYLKKNQIVTITLSLLLLVVLAFTGCNNAVTTTPLTTLPATTLAPITTTTAAPPTTKPVTTTPPPVTTTQAAPVELNISAASSLTDALTEVNKLYMQLHDNVKLTTSFGASGTLQKQIEQGAPADVFLSAGAKQVDALQTENLTIKETRVNLLTNKVVLVVPNDSTLTFASFADVTQAGVLKIAIGDPDSVPAGTYGKAALTQLKVWDQVQSKLILCTDVKQVLSYVEAGNVEAGIVYATDAAISTKVKIAAAAPAEVNAKIIYPATIIKATKNANAAKAYLAFLSGTDAKTIFEKYGFVVVQK